MKLEAGKYYKLGNGNKLHCVEVRECNEHLYPVIGLEHLREGERHLRTFQFDGRYRSNVDKSEHDVVSEWEDPKFKITTPGVYRMRNGEEVLVFCICPSDFKFPIKGFKASGTSQLWSWTADGRLMFEKGNIHSDDLVEKI